MCLRTKNLKIFIICAYLFFIYFIKKNSLLTGLKFLNCLRIIIDIHLVCPADLSAYERSLWPTKDRYGLHSEMRSGLDVTSLPTTTFPSRQNIWNWPTHLHEYRHAGQVSPTRITCQWHHVWTEVHLLALRSFDPIAPLEANFKAFLRLEDSRFISIT